MWNTDFKTDELWFTQRDEITHFVEASGRCVANQACICNMQKNTWRSFAARFYPVIAPCRFLSDRHITSHLLCLYILSVRMLRTCEFPKINKSIGGSLDFLRSKDDSTAGLGMSGLLGWGECLYLGLGNWTRGIFWGKEVASGSEGVLVSWSVWIIITSFSHCKALNRFWWQMMLFKVNDEERAVFFGVS